MDPTILEACTGLPTVDAQHRDLFECVDEIKKASESGRLFLTIHAIDRLRKYVRHHFAAEEQLMGMRGYPRLKEHRSAHRAFSAKLMELTIENTRRDNTTEIVRFLTEWLSEHVAKADMDYVPYVTSEIAEPSEQFLEAPRNP